METTMMSGSQVLLKDLSGYGNDGTCYNSGTVVSCGGGSGGPQIVSGNGTSGKAMSFDGVDDSVNMSNLTDDLQLKKENTVIIKASLRILN
jgi:hypothetical protein